jgi:chromosome segregation ATPase
MLSKIEAFKNRPKVDKNAELKKMELMELNDQLKKLKDEAERQDSEFVLLKSEYENRKMEIRKLKKSDRPEAYEKLGSEPKQADNSELNNKIEDLKKKIKESKSDIYANDAKMNAISTNSKKREDFNKRNGILLSGCEANQTSSDAFIDHKFQGAFTYALSKVLKDNNYYITYAKLIVEINRLLDQLGYEQNPQLECPDRFKNSKFLG